MKLKTKKLISCLVGLLLFISLFLICPLPVSAAGIAGAASDGSIIMAPDNTNISGHDNTWTLNITQGTLKGNAGTDLGADLTVSGLIPGLDWSAQNIGSNNIGITVSGTANSAVSAQAAVSIIIKSNAVSESGMADSAPITVNINPYALSGADISPNFNDANFKQMVWSWLGCTGTPGPFAQQDLIDQMTARNHILDVNSGNISSLDGLGDFTGTGLLSLDCSNNQLTSLPALPDGLQYLDCHDNQLASLPGLPASLQELRCYQNQLGSLPDPLPASLLRLNCSGNQLTGLPVLPAGLLMLGCNNNTIATLPALPNGLQYLNCYQNQLASLPALPNGLQYLDCYQNQLASLPGLPASLQELRCYQNQLGSLP
ncbi:MAG: leucine-rich repeat domain-containing protein, partial [Syntrophomonas sp.]